MSSAFLCMLSAADYLAFCRTPERHAGAGFFAKNAA